MPLCFFLLSLGTLTDLPHPPSTMDGAALAAPASPQLANEEPAARAWLALREKERGEFKKLAEGTYLIKSSPALEKAGDSSEMNDVWTLWKLENGDFQVDGEFRASRNGKEAATDYQVNLNPQMQLQTYKIFAKKLVSGCVWTAARLYCQETFGGGDVEGSAGASINNSTRLFAPTFPFLLSGLTPNLKIQPGKATYLTLLSLSYSDEARALIHLFPEYAAVRLVRPVTSSVGATNLAGSEFQLDVREIPDATYTSIQNPVIPPDPGHKNQYRPFFKFQVAANGILLSASDAVTQTEFIRLVQFKKFEDF
jgi:hypothetical protein